VGPVGEVQWGVVGQGRRMLGKGVGRVGKGALGACEGVCGAHVRAQEFPQGGVWGISVRGRHWVCSARGTWGVFARIGPMGLWWVSGVLGVSAVGRGSVAGGGEGAWVRVG